MSSSPAEIITRLNNAFLKETSETIASEVERSFTKDAVVVAPDLTRAARGSKAIAQSYVEFKQTARIIDVWLGNPEIDESDDVAVATLPWRMTYEYRDVRSSEEGDDIYVFRRESSDWKICWRGQHSHATKH